MKSLSAPAQSRADKLELYKLLKERERRQEQNKLATYFQDEGPLRRELYKQHLQFFKLGKTYPTRCFMAANRVGKTEGGGGYETTLHLTGRYPDWWEGHRFDHHIDAWAAGDTNETVRDIIQGKMIGPKEAPGTGLIPGKYIRDIKYRQGGNGAVDYVLVEHVSGKLSRLGFKSYEQGRKSFQGTEKHLIWLDEESNPGIRAECIIRLMTTAGLLIETFTPLHGLTEIVQGYLGEGGLNTDARVQINGERAMIMAGWDDVPHLSSNEKTRMLAECEPHLRDSRSKGIPSLGSGAIYPVPETEIIVDPFMIPAHFKKSYGMDVGWKKTASVWGATDPETGVTYLYSEHYRGQAEPSVHASAIHTRGDWIPGAIDPAARGRSQKDGEQLYELYTLLGLKLEKADNAVEAGIHKVFEMLSTGQLKVFKTLQNWLSEYRIYRRDEKGKIVKENDHIMDATRYLVMTGIDMARTKPIKRSQGRGVTRSRNWKTR
ncbi:terminase large subunit domain-containing protein [Gilvimarinus chinensis]|uniref:terminase large subunit domain-containing protein n=1 Tax=Gilvimarinus chinensis TaxID=396005 RepID=UPI0003784E78|nr:terminase family protein [Gilvimarinus chinensis]